MDRNFDGEQEGGEPGVPNAVILLDNSTRIVADANGLFNVPTVNSGWHTATLDLRSMRDYVLARNHRFIERNSQSRLVRLEPGGLARLNFAVTPRRLGEASSVKKRKKTRRRALALTGAALLAGTPNVLLLRAQPAQSAPASDPNAVLILTPDVLDTPAATVTLCFPVGATVELLANGDPVSPKQIGRTETDSAAGTVKQTWYGVILHEGANTLTALASVNGTLMPQVRRTVQVRTAPQQLVLHVIGAHVPADGRSLLTVTGRLLDVQGNVFPQDGLVTLMATGGEWVGVDADPDTPGFQVRVRGGQFSATLRAGLHAQTVHIRAAAGKLEAFAQAEFTTDLRPSLVTGVLNLRYGGRSTDFYRSFEDFLPPPGVSDGPQWDGYASVFATGRVGNSLFTGAYNSRHALNRTFSGETSLGRDTQQSDQQYPIYGDGSV